MNQTGKSIIALAVTRVLRKYEELGSIRAGCGIRGERPSWAAGWVPGMDDTGGLGPIPQATIDAISEEVAKAVEEQLDAAQGVQQAPDPPKTAKRQRPDWISVVEDGQDDESEADSDEG